MNDYNISTMPSLKPEEYDKQNTSVQSSPEVSDESIFKTNDIDYENQETFLDDAFNFLNLYTPDLVFKKMSENYIKFSETSHDLVIDNEKAFESLPRTEDGQLDVDKIKTSLTKSASAVAGQNAQALEVMDYGIYREAINETSLLVALLGPEVANIVTTCGGDKLPSWLSEGVPIFDILDDAYVDLLDGKLPDGCSYAIEDVAEFLNVESSREIRENIQKQNEEINSLLNFEINNDEDAKTFLEEYSRITGASFFCDKIDESYEILNDEDSDKIEKMEAYQQAFGSSKNFIDANKNKILTDVAYEFGIKYLIPVAINDTNTIPTKIISTALPTQIELTEVATQGREEGQLINFKNFDYNSLINIMSEGAVDGLFVNIHKSFAVPRGKGRKLKSKGLRIGISKALVGLSKLAFKATIPNYSSWAKGTVSALIPGSGLFMKTDEKS